MNMNKKIIISAFTIFAAVAVVAGATTAFFSDTETSTGNTFTAGSIDLQIDNTSYLNGVFNQGTSWTLTDLVDELFFNFDDIKPGDWGEDTISIHVVNNPSWVCADTTLTLDDENGLTEPELDLSDDGPDGELADELEFAWWADDGDNVLEDDEQIIEQGKLGNAPLNSPITSTLADASLNIWSGQSNDPLDGLTTVYIAKAWCFGDLTLTDVAQDNLGAGQNNGPDVRSSGVVCNGASVTNLSQSDKVKMDISFSAVQSRNNDSFSCQS